MEKGDFSKYKIWLIGNLLFSIIIFIIVIYASTSKSIWVDEVFSLKLVSHNWAQMIKEAKMDVHPPLYYFILKMFISIFKNLGFNTVFIGKLTSFAPYFLMLTWLACKVAKKNGITTASLFCFCLIGMPNLLIYSIEIRGYSWAMFFVTAAFIYAGDVITEEKGKKAWILFTFFGVLAAYTHYFSCIAVAIVYLGLLIFKKLDRDFLCKWFMSVFVSCILYIPWVFVFFRQFGKVLGEYWIGKITVNSIYGYFRFLFEPQLGKFHLDIILGILLAISYIVLVCMRVKEVKKREKNWMFWGNAVLVLTVITGIVVSLAARPVFVSRYMIVAAGCFWLCFAWLCSFIKRKKSLFYFCLLLICLVCLINVGQFVRWEKIRKDYYEDFSAILNEISDEDKVVADGEHMQGCLSYYLNNDDVLEVSNLQTIAFLDRELEKNNRIWCFSVNMDQITIDELNKKYEVSFWGEHHLEYYTFEVFCIEE